MELKFKNLETETNVAEKLLIEPYGIEIHHRRRHRERLLRLLIEPYGIEIRQRRPAGRYAHLLLIEPYGIEMADCVCLQHALEDF